jgi:hypothetical protein
MKKRQIKKYLKWHGDSKGNRKERQRQKVMKINKKQKRKMMKRNFAIYVLHFVSYRYYRDRQ